VASFRPKGLIDSIINTRPTSGFEGIDGFPSGHPNLNIGHPGLMENIVGGVMNVKMHPTSFRPKEVEDEAPKNVKRLSNVREAASMVALNIKRVFLFFNNKFT
jgi:hypothetical protein